MKNPLYKLSAAVVALAVCVFAFSYFFIQGGELVLPGEEAVEEEEAAKESESTTESATEEETAAVTEEQPSAAEETTEPEAQEEIAPPTEPETTAPEKNALIGNLESLTVALQNDLDGGTLYISSLWELDAALTAINDSPGDAFSAGDREALGAALDGLDSVMTSINDLFVLKLYEKRGDEAEYRDSKQIVQIQDYIYLGSIRAREGLVDTL